MRCEAHIIGSVALGYGIVSLSNQIGIDVNPIFFIGGAAFGALLPDIDHPKSKLGRKIEPVSTIIMAAVGHRTFTHSLLFSSIVGIVSSMWDISLGVGVLVGMLSHILLDLLTPETNGVAFLYPFYRKRIRLLKKIN